MRLATLVCGLYLALSGVCYAQQELNNQSIDKMAKAGLGDDVIVSMIQSQPGKYDLTPDAMIALKADGVSSKVLAAMAARVGPATAQAPTPANTPSFDDFDLGVYRMVKGEWIIVPTELVNWKTGGVLKTIASDGIVKGDVNGHIKGAQSQTTVNSPLQFLVKTQDGLEATDFQLVRLHKKSDAREFRTMTGGVFHSSGGASRDAVTFEQKKIAKHTYEITLPVTLPPGEYAFLAPGRTQSTTSGATGKAYTFHFAE
jgi:hypothetical protein